MKSDLNVQIAYIKLHEVNLHAAVSGNVISAITPIAHSFKVPDVLTEKGINFVLHSHPIQVLTSSKNTYECFAGLRSFQIAKAYLGDDHKIPVLIHQKMDESEISILAILDTLTSHTIFGLDSKTWQLDFARILKNFDIKVLKEFFPVAKNKTTFAKLLKTDRRTFLQNKKPITKIVSELKSSSSNLKKT